jgi:hypothetical protein
MKLLSNNQVGCMLKHVPLFCMFDLVYSVKNKLFIFSLRAELERTNDQLKEYRELIHLINEKTLTTTTSIDDLNSSSDDSKPVEKNYCLYDNTENKFIFLYSKPPLSIEQLSLSSQIE